MRPHSSLGVKFNNVEEQDEHLLPVRRRRLLHLRRPRRRLEVLPKPRVDPGFGRRQRRRRRWRRPRLRRRQRRGSPQSGGGPPRGRHVRLLGCRCAAAPRAGRADRDHPRRHLPRPHRPRIRQVMITRLPALAQSMLQLQVRCRAPICEYRVEAKCNSSPCWPFKSCWATLCEDVSVIIRQGDPHSVPSVFQAVAPDEAGNPGHDNAEKYERYHDIGTSFPPAQRCLKPLASTTLTKTSPTPRTGSSGLLLRFMALLYC